MRFLLDHDVWAITAQRLRQSGHDVVTAFQLGLTQAKDEELLSIAKEQQRIFVTRDRDFGSLVFVKALEIGVIYLRILPTTQATTHDELERVLQLYSEAELMKAFVVIEPDGHRFRKLLKD